MEPIYVHSRITGGHYALKTKRARKPFENPIHYYARLRLLPSDIVVDIGGYVGEYSLYAIKCGVKKVITYEPSPDAFKLLTMNKKQNMEIINAAVTGNLVPSVRLFLSKGIGVTNSIVKSRGKKGNIIVPAISYKEVISVATVVKIDVEGAEYDYPIIQPNLRGIIIEFHPIEGKPWRYWADNIMDQILKAGYKTVCHPTFKCGWDLTGCWEK